MKRTISAIILMLAVAVSTLSGCTAEQVGAAAEAVRAIGSLSK